MRRQRPSSDPTTPPNDWLARADQERTHRDSRWRQRATEQTQQAAAREAWRPEVSAVGSPAQRALRGTRDR